MGKLEIRFDNNKFREAAQDVKRAIDRVDETNPKIDRAYKEFQEVSKIFNFYPNPCPVNMDRLLDPLFIAQYNLQKASEELTEAARELTMAERSLYYGLIINDGTDELTDESEAKQ